MADLFAAQKPGVLLHHTFDTRRLLEPEGAGVVSLWTPRLARGGMPPRPRHPPTSLDWG